nr:unnamed protein product [Callosobruchus chinensis]
MVEVQICYIGSIKYICNGGNEHHYYCQCYRHSHICQKEEECVEGATCIVRPKEFQTSSTSYLNNYMVCWCEDGVAFPNGRCAARLGIPEKLLNEQLSTCQQRFNTVDVYHTNSTDIDQL